MSELGGLDNEVTKEEMDSGNVTPFPETEKKKRKPFHYWTVGEREYKLKLTTQMIEKLENKYRSNMLSLVMDSGIPPLSIMLTIAQAAMAPWQHGVGYSEVKKIYSNWVDNGGDQMTFFSSIIMPTLAVSGFFTEKQAESLLESVESMDDLL